MSTLTVLPMITLAVLSLVTFAVLLPMIQAQGRYQGTTTTAEEIRTRGLIASALSGLSLRDIRKCREPVSLGRKVTDVL